MSRPDPLEAVIDATPADRLRWALLEQGIDPAQFDLADDNTQPRTVVVRTPLRTAARGLLTMWWDVSAGRAAGLVAGSDDEMREAIAVLEALTATGPGDVPLAPPEDPLDPWSTIAATALRLGLMVRSRPLASGMRAIFAVRDWLTSENAVALGLLKSDRHVLRALVTYMDPDGRSGRPSAKLLAAGIGLTERTAARSLRRLRDAGLIQATVEPPTHRESSGMGTHSRVQIDARGARLDREGERASPGPLYRGERASSDTRGGLQRHKRGPPRAPQSSRKQY
jgi:hypothetical protein